MDALFWHQKWERGEIGFHNDEVNPLLTGHFEKLNLGKGNRVFLPLCGKTRDISWLLGNGYHVVGAELSGLAIKQLFEDLNIEPDISDLGTLLHYSAMNIDIFVGDIFDVSTTHIGDINAIYDRAALVALPANIREKYTSHLLKITNAAPQLIITYEYDQQQMDGPPFSVTVDEVERHYGAYYLLNSVENNKTAEKFRGKVVYIETVLLLQKQAD